MPLSPLEITYSQLLDFRRCRLRWYWMYQKNLLPIVEREYYAFGRAIHHGLCQYYLHGHDIEVAQTAFSEEWNKYKEKLMEVNYYIDSDDEWLNKSSAMGLHMLEDYHFLAKNADKFEVIMAEERLKFSIGIVQGREVFLAGTPDMVVKDNKFYWLKEFKSTTNMNDTDWVELDEQASIYQFLAQMKLLVPIHGTFYSWLNKSLPKEPKILENGKMSKDKSQPVSAVDIAKKIEEFGLDHHEYKDFMEVMRSKYVVRTRVHRSPTEITNVVKRSLQIAQDMVNPEIYCSPTWNCHWECEYYKMCVAYQDEADLEPIEKAYFKVGEVTW